MDGLIEGRIVHYVVNHDDVAEIGRSRHMSAGAERGNSVMAGEHFPAIIVRIFDNEFGNEPGANLQVFLDGNDSLWVTSKKFAEPEKMWPGTWHWIEKA